MLTIHKDELYINWQFGAHENITVTENDEVIIKKVYLQLEPIGVVLVFFFFSIIVIQFVAMLFHRYYLSNFSHYCLINFTLHFIAESEL